MNGGHALSHDARKLSGLQFAGSVAVVRLQQQNFHLGPVRFLLVFGYPQLFLLALLGSPRVALGHAAVVTDFVVGLHQRLKLMVFLAAVAGYGVVTDLCESLAVAGLGWGEFASWHARCFFMILRMWVGSTLKYSANSGTVMYP